MNEDTYHLGVKAIIQNKEGNILLLKTNPKYLKGYMGEPYWDIPGGRIQINATVEETLRRELLEETGIDTIKKFSPFSMVLSPVRIPVGDSTVGLILASYLCVVDEADTITLSDEHTDYHWFGPEATAKLLAVKYPPEFVNKVAKIKKI